MFEVNNYDLKADGPSSEDVTTPKRDLSKNARNILPEYCEVCGNRAIGYHYDVATCNGCKAFFRRTIITGRKFLCKKGHKCLEKADPRARRLCPGCRFEKCEKVGMNPMNIQAEMTQKGELLRQQFIASREFEQSINRTPTPIEDKLSIAISKLTLIEDQVDDLFNSNIPAHYGDMRTLTEILQMNPILEVSRIPDLKFLTSQLFPDHAGFCHNIYLSMVEFTKMFDSFSKLSIDSIKKLIRHGASMCVGLMASRRSIRKFNADSLRRTDGTIAGKPDRSWNGIWVEHKKMIQKVLHSFVRNKIDDVEFMFLKAIAICNPAVPDLRKADQVVVEKERFRYATALLDYCFRTYGSTHGADRFGSILSVMTIMENQQREEKCFYVILRSYFSHVDMLVSPLYDEIMAS
ncbi:hypothetical protein GCK72_018184 [Caenorhabditis remanei]|uniref:Uncharacterized protein n=1 Tax=Caenorhabditis remanei TaxID=31234 RepID=A0A6A5G9D8_CAERE|nr:hypothetical protein GCK72_018184 [Caenorhabditis remanei]KAF1751630.1 hypothetical protein GCK72_018184 [Caenorhabditis remanei]